MAFAILLACQLGFNACKKNPVEAKNEKEVANIENQDKVLKFLSTVLNVPVSKIKTDLSTEEFYIPDTGFRITISEATERYNSSNIYKAQYEK
ncbi:hypothetical protein LL912_11895 [Niabella sp. CC-SYL272]|uniref:hypothetical protein n=1 Tax=Niabella agricola TaxID=2891571 RepID=UPI001F27C07A|nr:hypothetical protein [Niabella agricola]MCF3109474.1 hypothetical protein [Niabella agricola]